MRKVGINDTVAELGDFKFQRKISIYTSGTPTARKPPLDQGDNMIFTMFKKKRNTRNFARKKKDCGVSGMPAVS